MTRWSDMSAKLAPAARASTLLTSVAGVLTYTALALTNSGGDIAAD